MRDFHALGVIFTHRFRRGSTVSVLPPALRTGRQPAFCDFASSSALRFLAKALHFLFRLKRRPALANLVGTPW
jgi:hypothetical protein